MVGEHLRDLLENERAEVPARRQRARLHQLAVLVDYEGFSVMGGDRKGVEAVFEVDVDLMVAWLGD